MWTTGRTKKAIISPRPVRIAYLVPSPPTHNLLDVLFDEAMSRWGGRRTPVIVTEGAEIAVDYWNLLDAWDADIIYSYVDLQDSLHSRLAHRLAPAALIRHPRDEDANDLRPRLATNEELLPSVSVLPVFWKRCTAQAQPVPEVLDKERGVDAPRDLADSFGFVSNHLNDFTLLPYGHRVSLRPSDDRRYAARFRSPDEITYIDTLGDLETKLADRYALLCLAQMSDMFAPYLSSLVGLGSSWEDHLSIIIGVEVSDRLLFWNGIHRYKTLTNAGNFQLLRLSPDRFADGLPEWVARLCSGHRNQRHFRENYAPGTVVRSCSIEEAALEGVAQQVRATGLNMCSAVRHSEDDIFQPLRDRRPQNPRGQGHLNFTSGWQSQAPRTAEQVRFDGDQFELPPAVPFHLKDQSVSAVNVGVWAVDLRIDRNEDHSRYDNHRHRWMFPRRLRLDAAVRLESYGGNHLTIPPRARPTEEGDLAIWDALQWTRPLLSLPTDLQAFGRAIAWHHPEIPQGDAPREGPKLVHRFSPVEVSDKGRDLLGVFQLFRSLPEALLFLTNPFWVSIVKRLCPTEPDANPRRIAELAAVLRQAVEQRGDADVDYDRLARRAMGKVATWVDADNKANEFIRYQTLVGLVPKELKVGEWQNELATSVKYLRDRTFLRQGYGWTCVICQHSNWVHLSEARPILLCEICRNEESWPVCGDDQVHFRLNPFVAAAFSSSSSQGPVVWTMSRLASRASWSFMFTPALDIYRPGEHNPYTDIDVLAAVDGEVFLLEVKRSFTGVDARQIARLVELAGILRPDYAGFAVQRPRAECSLDAATQQQIERELADKDVRFLLWASGDPDPMGFPKGIPAEFGRTMKWSAW